MHERNVPQINVQHGLEAEKGYAWSFKNSDGETEENLPNSYSETGSVSGGFLCRSAPLAVALLPFPLLGEPAVDPDPAYRIFKGFSYGPWRAHEKTGCNIQGKILQQNFFFARDAY